MLTGQSCWLQGAKKKGQVFWLLNQAASLELAGQLHPCKKSNDAELASCGEEKEPDTHLLISNIALIWKLIRGGRLQEFCQHCQMKPFWGRSRNISIVWTCKRCLVWVLAETSRAGWFPPRCRFWQTVRGVEQAPGSSYRLQLSSSISGHLAL